jgi:hypothetical protein
MHLTPFLSRSTKTKEMSKMTHSSFNRNDINQATIILDFFPDDGFNDVILLWICLTI